MLSHLNMMSAATSITTYLENVPEDIIIDVLPLSFDYGLYQVLMAFKVGGTVILERSFAYPYEAIKQMVKERVTGFPGVPTIFAILLQMEDLGRYDLSCFALHHQYGSSASRRTYSEDKEGLSAGETLLHVWPHRVQKSVLSPS